MLPVKVYGRGEGDEDRELEEEHPVEDERNRRFPGAEALGDDIGAAVDSKSEQAS